MSIVMQDLKGGLAVVRSVQVAVAVFLVFATGVELAAEALSEGILSEGLPDLPFDPIWLSFVLVSWVVPLLTTFLLALFMIEIAAIGGDRVAGKETRMHLVFSGRVAWSLFLACVFSLLIVLLLTWLLSAFQGVIATSLLGDAVRQGDGNADMAGTLSTIWTVGAVNQLLVLIAVAFGVSRYALIPLIVRHRDVSFGEAWTIQNHGFDNSHGNVRNRFFRVFLALLVLDGLFALAVAQVTSSDLISILLVYPVGILLIIVVPTGILTHMVRSQPVLPRDTVEVSSTDAENPGEGRPE